MTYYYASERMDFKRIDKLNTLTNIKTFWDDVRKFTKNISSDHSISHWQSLAECKYNELLTGCEDVRIDFDYNKETKEFTKHFYNPRTGEEVYPKECCV